MLLKTCWFPSTATITLLSPLGSTGYVLSPNSQGRIQVGSPQAPVSWVVSVANGCLLRTKGWRNFQSAEKIQLQNASNCIVTIIWYFYTLYDCSVWVRNALYINIDSTCNTSGHGRLHSWGCMHIRMCSVGSCELLCL